MCAFGEMAMNKLPSIGHHTCQVKLLQLKSIYEKISRSSGLVNKCTARSYITSCKCISVTYFP